MVDEPADVRCPNCGALVSEDAEWCGQCYASLRSEPQPSPESAPAPPEPAARAPGPPVTGPASAAPGTDGAAAAAGDAGPAWPCLVCGARNPMELDVCATCGTAFGRGLEPVADRGTIMPGAALGWSLLFPGLGHGMAGRWAEGAARMALFAWALGTAVAFWTARPSSGLGALGPILFAFFLAAIALYAEAAVDAQRLAAGDPQLVTPRQLMWAGVGLSLLTVLAVVVLTLRSTTVEPTSPFDDVPVEVVPGPPTPTPMPTPSATITPSPSPTATGSPTDAASPQASASPPTSPTTFG